MSLTEAVPQPRPAAPASFDVGSTTHVGRVRQANEDRFFVAPGAGIFAVADGMGGHEGGALASSTIVDELAQIGPTDSAPELLAQLEARVIRANSALHGIARERRKTLGSTLVVLLTFGPNYACLWAGDSRAYRVRQGTISQISRDHSEVRELVDRGILTPAEAKTWPRRNVITRAIGITPDPELEIEQGALEPGDVFILCSDGLTGHVDDAEILAVVVRSAAQDACQSLLDLTLQRGASDNVTIVVVRYAPHVAAYDGQRDPTVVLGEAAQAQRREAQP